MINERKVYSGQYGQDSSAGSQQGFDFGNGSDYTGGESGVFSQKLGNLPDNVKSSYQKYNENGWSGNVSGQTTGTKAGGVFKNRDRKLPTMDKNGNAITYKEFDGNNKMPNSNRDRERFIRGSDGSTYYTNDHYDSFVKIE